MKKLILAGLLLILVPMILAGCGPASDKSLVKVKLMLDWVPNTNHTGIFIAQEKGYFKEAGLSVEIIQPGEVYPEAAVASGVADFGISFQEIVTLARRDNVPVVSIAAVLQHNTSGFASLTRLNVTNPSGFEGLRYGSFGSPFEEPTIKVLMECRSGDFSKVKIVQTGFSDPLALLAENQIDLAWIFYGWQGFQAKKQGIDLNVVMMKDYFDCVPDYYTPIIITNENMIKKNPQVVKSLLKALSKGYTFAAENPEEAAQTLVSAVPELDKELVKASQKWLSPFYTTGAPRWGEQKESVWQNYANWMLKHGVLKGPVDVPRAFTNQYLP